MKKTALALLVAIGVLVAAILANALATIANHFFGIAGVVMCAAVAFFALIVAIVQTFDFE